MTDKQIINEIKKFLYIVCDEECGVSPNKCGDSDCRYWQILDIIEGKDNDRKTLIEIKEIAITGLEGFCPKCSRKDCEDNNCIETAIRDILQKISECEVE